MHEELNISFGIIPDQFFSRYLPLVDERNCWTFGRTWWIAILCWGCFGLVDCCSHSVSLGMGREYRTLACSADYTEGAISNGTPVFGALYGSMIRPLGIGTLIGGALMGVIVSFPAIKSAFASLSSAAKTASSGGKSWF